MNRKLSEIHRCLHRSNLESARRVRQDGAQHARLLVLAAVSRFYFAHLRGIGE